MDFIKQQFRRDEILLIYKCGSYAFGTSTDVSDEDYVVVLKDFKGITHSSNGKKEYFIFGLEEWKEKQEFIDKYDEYYLIFNDEVLAFPDSIIYAHESIQDLIEKYKNEFALKYKLWIKNVVSHFKFYFGIGDVNKSMYHLIRIKHIVENYKTTGAFSLDLSKEVHEWILEFKKAQNKAPYRQTLYEALVYLENIKEE